MPNYDRIGYARKTLKGVEIDRAAIRAITGASPHDNPLGKLEDLTDDDLVLSPPTLYGFSLSDKQWCESAVSPFEKRSSLIDVACSGVLC